MRLYRIGADGKLKKTASLDEELLESRLEEVLEANPEILDSDGLLVIGRQVVTDTGKRLDLVCLDRAGRIVVAELKRGIAPREVIAQVIDYSVWLDGLSDKQLENIYRAYSIGVATSDRTLHQQYERKFGKPFDRDLEDGVVLILLARDFPAEVTRAAAFLSERGVLLKCVSFDMFGSDQLEETLLVTRDAAGSADKPEMTKEKLPTKRDDRHFAREIADELESAYGDALDSLKHNRARLKVYQTKDGTLTSVYSDYKYDDVAFVFEVQLLRTGEAGVHIPLWTRTESAQYKAKLADARFMKQIENLGFRMAEEDGEKYVYATLRMGDKFEIGAELKGEIIKVVGEAAIPALKMFLGEE